jgi:phosphoheptose isomerase
VLSRWKQEFMAKATQVFEQPQDMQEKETRIAELERMVGKLTMQIELQKKVLNLGNPTSHTNE